MGRYRRKGMAVAVVPVAIILPLCLALAYLVGHGYLIPDLGPFHLNPVGIVGLGIVLSVPSAMLIFVAISASDHWMLRLWAKGQPAPPSEGVLARLVRHDTSGIEVLISGMGGKTPRDLLREEWPFDTQYGKRNWHVIDENDNEVTDLPLSWSKGVLHVRFD